LRLFSSVSNKDKWFIFVTTVYGGALVFCGYDKGMNTQEVYSVPSRSWLNPGEYFPRTTFPTNGNAGCAYVNGYFYAFGGRNDLSNGGNQYVQRILLQPNGGVNIINFFASSLIIWTNKLECLFLAGLFSLS
jgi:hypothetical protein